MIDSADKKGRIIKIANLRRRGCFIVFLKWANPDLFFVYFRPFLITISIIQIEKA